MAQLNFLDADKRLAALSKQGDPLEAIARLVPWEEFRAEIEAVVLTADADKKNTAGRKPIDALVMFRMLVVQSPYNLSDEQAEYQARVNQLDMGPGGPRAAGIRAETNDALGSSTALPR